MHKFTTICFALLFSFSAYSQTISPTQADTLIKHHFADSSFLILDVRTPGEYASGHLQNSTNLDYNGGVFTAQLSSLDKTKLYLIHCQSGGRSGLAYNDMISAGFSKVYNMSGGYSSWNSQGFPKTSSTQKSLVRILDAPAFYNKLNSKSSPSTYIADLRPSANYSQAHIELAENIDSALTNIKTFTAAKGDVWFVYGNALTAADSAALYKAYLNPCKEIYVLKDGFQAWQTAGYATTDFNTATNDILLEFSPKAIHIKLPEGTKADAFVYSTAGNLISKSGLSIDCSNLRTGVYTLLLLGKDFRLVKKFLWRE